MTAFSLRRALALIFISLLLAVVWAEHVKLLREAATWWVVSDQLEVPSDAIVVLGGGFETRPEAAADLYNRGLGKRILVINPEMGEITTGPTIQDQTFAKLQKLGVPATSIINLKNPTPNTYKEARSVLVWATTNKKKNIVVPTDLFHTRRVHWIFEKELGAAGINVHVFAIKQLHYSLDNWWQYKEGWAAFMSEILKYAFYRVKY